MAWRQTGAKPLPEPMITKVYDTICHYQATLSEDEVFFKSILLTFIIYSEQCRIHIIKKSWVLQRGFYLPFSSIILALVGNEACFTIVLWALKPKPHDLLLYSIPVPVEWFINLTKIPLKSCQHIRCCINENVSCEERQLIFWDFFCFVFTICAPKMLLKCSRDFRPYHGYVSRKENWLAKWQICFLICSGFTLLPKHPQQ